MNIPSKAICFGILGICCYSLSQAQVNVKKNAFTIHGSIGASGNFYTSNEVDTFKTRPKYAWNIYGSFTPKINKISFPLSFVINDYSPNNRSPHIQFGISPTYKWAKLHLGTRSMVFSPLIYYGQSFTGAGIELNPGIFRFAAFYGRLNRLIRTDTIDNTIPRFLRKAYGVKVGVGNASNYFDLIYFHAKDDSSSSPFSKINIVNDTLYNATRPQENAVFGSSFKLTFFKKLIFTGDVAVSGLTQNLTADSLNLDSAYQYQKLYDFVSNFMTINVSSLASVAGQSSLSFYSRYFNASVNYRRVQPGFNSFGTPYMLNDVELFSFNNSFSLAKGKLRLNSGISRQHNNLNNNLNNEVQTVAGNIGLNAVLTKHLNLNASYFRYGLKQKPAAESVNDTAVLRQSISQLNITPTYNFTKGNYIHVITGNLNFSSLNNSFISKSFQANSNNVSTSLNYSLGFIKQYCNFFVTGLYNKYKLDTTRYNSAGITPGASVSVLKEKNLNLQASVGYFFNSYKTLTDENKNSNFSYSINASYTAKQHSFNLFINYLYTPPKLINNSINKTFQYAVAFKSFMGSISYNYRF